MLGESAIHAVVAVRDIEKSKTFYETTLGLTIKDESLGGILYKCGDTDLFVYSSAMAGTNQATCAFWKVDNVEKCVEELKSKGVVFEHYDMPGVTLEGDLHLMGPMKAAWFKDPDGNILNVTNGLM